MHLLMAPIVISGLIAKLKTRKLNRQLQHPAIKTPELTVLVQSIQENIQRSSGSDHIEQDKTQAKTAIR